MRHLTWIIVSAILLVGCQTSGIYVPVSGVGEVHRHRARLYVVHRGDTLYSIAFRYGMDFKQLAAINNIHPPYTIYIGDRLRLGREASPPVADTRGRPASPAAPAPSPPPQIDVPDVADARIDWQWPYEGSVVNDFSLTGKVNKGIDILGKPGAKVRSTAAGVVVYAGGGLRGYGKLVIVKHNDRFLSAYGRNATIYVKEGEQVKAGQVLSQLGSANGADELLHFEIRRDGKPQDPLKYLPRRENASN